MASDFQRLMNTPYPDGPSVEVKRDRAIHTSLTQCDQHLNTLESAVCSLVARLEPASRMRPPETAPKEVAEPQAPCPLATVIDVHGKRLLALRRTVEDLLDRLEL